MSKLQTTKVTLNVLNSGKVAVELSRTEFDEATADLIDRTGVLCDAVLSEAGLKWNSLTDVLLVGGSTRMPQVSQYLTIKLGKKPIAHVNPDEAVALGAAIQATKEDAQYVQLAVKAVNGVKKSASLDHAKNAMAVKPEKRLTSVATMKVNEIVTHAMGIIAISPDMTKYINDIIIPANHPIPVRAAKSFNFRTHSRGENELEIYVLQGYKDPLDCVIPYKYVVTDIRHIPEQDGQTTIRVQYSYDQNGIIHVDARQEQDKENLPIRKDAVEDDMSQYGMPIDPDVFNQPVPLSVTMAVDVSGSMSGAPLNDAKRAMCSFVDQMDMSYTKVGIIAVSDSCAVVQALTDDADRCKDAINGITCGQTGYGNATHPFELIKSQLANEDGMRYGIVLADGIWARQDIATYAAQECHHQGIDIVGIGFGSADKSFLESVSSTDENVFLVSQGELTKTFGKIAQSLGGSSTGNMRIQDVANSDIPTWE